MNEQNEIRGDEREDAFENAPEQSVPTEQELEHFYHEAVRFVDTELRAGRLVDPEEEERDAEEAMQNPGGDPWRLEW